MAAKSIEELNRSEQDIIRQGERTVDNLKRLFAVIFSLSFGLIGAGAADKLRAVVTGAVPVPTWGAVILNLEMAAVFVITAGVFYHQSTKFLDIRYARHPLNEAHPVGFAIDYLTLVLTAAPFFLMAQAYSTSVTQYVGFMWFFGSYVILLSLGLVLLVVTHLRNLRTVRVAIFKEAITDDEVRRESVLRQYWLVMNSTVLLLLLGCFWYAARSGDCPLKLQGDSIPAFVYVFVIVAILRDVLDYRWSWRFLYPLTPEQAARMDLWPLTWMAKSSHRWLWWVGYGLAIACAVMTFVAGIWDVSHWVTVCKP